MSLSDKLYERLVELGLPLPHTDQMLSYGLSKVVFCGWVLVVDETDPDPMMSAQIIPEGCAIKARIRFLIPPPFDGPGAIATVWNGKVGEKP